MTDRYVVPSGLMSTSSGTFDNPWPFSGIMYDPTGRYIRPGDTIYMREGVYRQGVRDHVNSNAMNFCWSGTQDNPITLRPYQRGRATIDGSFYGSYAGGFTAQHIIISGLEFVTSEGLTGTRESFEASTDPTDLNRPRGGMQLFTTSGMHIINNIFHATQDGCSVWKNTHSGELYGNIFFDVGWIGPDRWHGTPLYNQNYGNFVRPVINTAIYKGFRYSVEFYASDVVNLVNNFFVSGMMALGGHNDDRVLMGGYSGMHFYDGLLYSSNVQHGNVGDDAIYHTTVNSTFWKAGITADLGHLANPWFKTGNVFYDAGYSTLFSESVRPSSNLVKVQSNIYESGRAHIGILNFISGSSQAISLSGVATPGDRYYLYGSGDLWQPLFSGIYNHTGVITVPLTNDSEFYLLRTLSAPERYDVFVAPSGMMSNLGTIDSPWSFSGVVYDPTGRYIRPGCTINMRSGIYRQAIRNHSGQHSIIFTWSGTVERPIVLRPYQRERATIDGSFNSADFLSTVPTNVIISGLEFYITESLTGTRESFESSTDPSDLDRPRGGINVTDGFNVKIINNLIHGTQDGIYMWRRVNSGSLYGNIIYDVGWIAPDRYHGAGMYQQNEADSQRDIINNVIFDGFRYSTEFYASDPTYVNRFFVSGMIALGGRNDDRLLFAGTSGMYSHCTLQYHSMTNILFNSNPAIDYITVNSEFWKCYITNGFSGLGPTNWINTGHIFYDNNPLPSSNRIQITTNAHESGRAYIAILNFRSGSSESFRLTGVVTQGDRYFIYATGDFWDVPILSGVYDGTGYVTVPLGVPDSGETVGGFDRDFFLLRTLGALEGSGVPSSDPAYYIGGCTNIIFLSAIDRIASYQLSANTTTIFLPNLDKVSSFSQQATDNLASFTPAIAKTSAMTHQFADNVSILTPSVNRTSAMFQQSNDDLSVFGIGGFGQVQTNFGSEASAYLLVVPTVDRTASFAQYAGSNISTSGDETRYSDFSVVASTNMIPLVSTYSRSSNLLLDSRSNFFIQPLLVQPVPPTVHYIAAENAAIQQNSWGSTLLVDTLFDGNTVFMGHSTEVQMLFMKPDKTTIVKDALLFSGGVDGRVYYTVESGTLDQPGIWELQSFTQSPSGTWYSDIYKFRVYRNI